jgi:glutathione peroxidase
MHFPSITGCCFALLACVSSTTTLGAESLAYTASFFDGAGRNQPLSRFAGSPILIINVATRCGLAYQLTGFQALQEHYAQRGLVIMAVPSNDFIAGSPESYTAMANLFTGTYGVTFPILSAVHVRGPSRHPLYTWVAEVGGGGIRWNFEKILIGRNGDLLGHFGPSVEASDGSLVAAIESALDEP